MKIGIKSCQDAIGAVLSAARMAVDAYASCVESAFAAKRIYDDAINLCQTYLFKAKDMLTQIEKLCDDHPDVRKEYEGVILSLKDKIDVIEQRLHCLWHERAAAVLRLEDLVEEAHFLQGSVHSISDSSATTLVNVINEIKAY